MNPPIRVLLVEDTEDNGAIAHRLLAAVQGKCFHLERVTSYSEGLAKLAQNQHEICLVNYRLGQQKGLNLVQEAAAQGCQAPMILLTKQNDHETAAAAVQAGAVDYLVKEELTPPRLACTISSALGTRRTRIELNQALWEKSQLAIAVAHISTGLVITDPNQPDNPVVFVNPAFTQLTGYTPLEIIGKNCRLLQGTDTDFQTRRQIAEAIAQSRSITCTLLNYRRDGTPFWSQLTINPLFDPAGQLVNFIGLITDVTARQQAEAAIREREERYALAVQGANDGIWDWDLKTGQVYYSPRWKAMLGHQEHEVGSSLEEWLQRIHPEDLYWVKREITAHLHGQTPHFQSEYRMQHQNGKFHWMLSRGLAMRNPQGQVMRIAGSQTDVTAQKQAEEKLIRDALYDRLTELPNRVLLMERLQHAVQRSQRHALLAVLFVDLDRFKMINDSLGHGLGDQLLVAIARRLLKCLRPSDTIARLGGDEFVILLEDVKDAQAVTLVVDRIQRELSTSFHLEGHEIFAAASIGIALSSTGQERPEDLLRDADTAMHQAKAQGRRRYEMFHPRMHSHAVALLQLETDLHRAIERQQLLLHYQPLVCLRSRRIVGFEALLRWHHAQRGLIPPAEFIPVAEETGLILPIGWWALREACRQMQRWRQQFPSQTQLTVNVNLSSKQFTPQLTNQVRQILHETGLEARHLKLELTESVLMQNAESAVSTLTELQQLGIHLAIDDFGTGYSSLSYLHRFPIDTLKIDRSFTSKVDIDGEQLAIVRTIMTLAWNLGMEVVAEGIETPKQLAQLRALRCEYAQGYLFSKPLAAADAEQLISQQAEDWALRSSAG